MPFGSLGENILIDYNPYHLTAGDQLRIGEVLLEISQNCTMCDHLSKIDENLPTLLKDDRGIFAKVIKGGVIQPGDEITLLS
jgi:MOSC domain-containing protein YiiM